MANILQKPLRFIKKRIFNPRLIPVLHNHALTRLGSQYGGWTFVAASKLVNSAIISCGVGEDASFDIELASRFKCKVVLVDPTPKAIEHFNGIRGRFGSAASVPYTHGGKQPVEAYELSATGRHDIELVEKALWTTETTLRFYLPENPAHVSHSIVNFQHEYKQDTKYIEVESITVPGLLRRYEMDVPPLIKLDIEGAEIEVLIDMMERRIFPEQILVEYDELARPSKISRDRINSSHSALLQSGYDLINFEPPSNFLYFRARSSM